MLGILAIFILVPLFRVSLVGVESLPPFYLGAFPPTLGANFEPKFLRLSFKFFMFQFTMSTSCEFLFWIIIANSSDFPLTVEIFVHNLSLGSSFFFFSGSHHWGAPPLRNGLSRNCSFSDWHLYLCWLCNHI